MSRFTRRDFVAASALAAGAAIAGPARAAGAADRKAIYKEVERRHDQSVKRLQEWIGVGSIAAENVGMTEGCDMMRRLALDAGFQRAECIQTKGHPGVFATLDAGARRTLGLYFMYDVKQVNPEEWSSPPWAARLVDMPERGKVVMGRGAVNQGSAVGAVGSFACHPRRWSQAAGESRAGRRRRGGNRLAKLSADRARA